ncbi:MAG: 3-phosphoglycerate dehydrogenase, partial [Clostridia bacterium]|nr:3-phosphoglycerate dehydrogenase [Clostridia bacterium]
MRIQLKNKIAAVGTSRFPATYEVGNDVDRPDTILVRSADLLQTSFNPELIAIARAGAGVNNIP